MFGNDAMPRQRGLQAHVGAASQSIGHQKRVRLDLAPRWCQGIEPPAELEQSARLYPARQLQPQRPVIRTPGQQKPGRKDRLIGNQSLQIVKFNRGKLA